SPSATAAGWWTSAPHSARIRSARSGRPPRPRRPRRRRAPPSPARARSRGADAHLDVAEPRHRRAVADVRDLARLAFAAVRQAEQPPALRAADGIERGPEDGGDARVGGVAQ